MPPKAAKAEPKQKTEKTEATEDKEEKILAPDRVAFEAQETQIQVTIDSLEKKRQELTQKINDKSKGKDGFFRQKEEIRAKLDEFNKLINDKQEQKKSISKDVSDQKTQDRGMQDQLKKMKKAIGFGSEADIDARIAEIELLLRTESLTLRAEKDYVKEIQDLKKSRPKISQVNSMSENLKSTTRTGSLKDQMDTLNQELNIYYEGKRTVAEELKALNDKYSEQMGDIKPFMDERNDIHTEIKAKVEERKVLRDGFKTQEREYNDLLNQKRRQQRERNDAERQERMVAGQQSRRARDAEKLDTQPFLQEITLIEQTISFCKSLVSDKKIVTKEEKKETSTDAVEGMQVLCRKEDREQEYFYAPTASKKNKSKAKGAKESGSSKPIKHNATTFELFKELKLEVPLTTEDIPATLEKLEAQMEIYTEKVKIWQEQHEEMKRKLIEEGIYPEEWNKKSAGEKSAKADTKAEEAAPAVEAEAEAKATEE